MIEKVADTISSVLWSENYNGTYQSQRNEFIKAAKAAIAAMREPTEEMIKPFKMAAEDNYIKRCWNEAIDAALKE